MSFTLRRDMLRPKVLRAALIALLIVGTAVATMCPENPAAAATSWPTAATTAHGYDGGQRLERFQTCFLGSSDRTSTGQLRAPTPQTRSGIRAVRSIPGWFVAPKAARALNAPTEYNPWQGSPVGRAASGDEVFYRVVGGDSQLAGEWITPIRPESSAAARAGLALPEGNAATWVSEVRVPGGTRIQVGPAGSNFGQPGGWTQVRLLERIPLDSFGKGVPLGP